MTPKPFFELRQHRTEYAGPGREAPEPADVREVLIGYFGPSDPSHPDGGDSWRAAQWAVDEANAARGYHGKPFRLVPGWSDNPWKSGVVEVTRMVYRDRVWAIVGGIDGPTTHLAEQVVAKARVALVSPGSTDKTVNLANVPWMFSVLPGDHLQAPVLAAEIARQLAGCHAHACVGMSQRAREAAGCHAHACVGMSGRAREAAGCHAHACVGMSGRARAPAPSLVLVATDDHDSHLSTVELTKALSARGIAPRHGYECTQGAGDTDVNTLADKIIDARPTAALLVADARDSARLVIALRKRGFGGVIYGGPSMGRRRFLAEAGVAAEGLVFPLLLDPPSAASPWAEAFQDRYGSPPDYAAAATYDAVRLVIAAIHKSGLNRARIRDAIEDLSPWRGAGGTIQWDNLGANTRAVRLATIRNGRPTPLCPRP